MQDRFLRCLIYRQSQLNFGWTEEHGARLDQIAAEDHSYIATATERARREKHSVSRAYQFRTKRTHESKRRLWGCQENLSTTISRTWPSSPQTSSPRTSSIATRPTIMLGTTMVLSASTRRQAGSGTTLSKHQALLPQDGNRLRGDSHLHGHRHQSGCER